MKKLMILVLVVLGAACQNPPQKLSDQDIAAIRATIDKYVSTALARDWDAWGSTVATDAIFYPSNQEPIEGREAIVAWGKSFPTITSLALPTDEISGYNDIAYATGTFSYTGSMDDGTTFSEQGSYIDIFGKQPDGSWLYTRSMFHSTVPMPVAAASEMAK